VVFVEPGLSFPGIGRALVSTALAVTGQVEATGSHVREFGLEEQSPIVEKFITVCAKNRCRNSV